MGDTDASELTTSNPTVDLATDAEYFVRVQPNAVQDAAGNLFEGFVDPTALSFTTADDGGGEDTVPVTAADAGTPYTALDTVT